MADLGIKEVTLIGGEAYLRPDWLTLIAAVRRHGMYCTMTTGGRGITAERPTRAVEAGLQSAAVSLDGMAAAHHRQRALDGSFRAGVRALEHFRAAGIRVSVNTTGARLAAATDRAHGARRGSPLLRRYMPDQHRGSCGAGKVVLGLEANGTVKGCPSLPTAEWAGGNATATTLKTAWAAAPGWPTASSANLGTTPIATTAPSRSSAPAGASAWCRMAPCRPSRTEKVMPVIRPEGASSDPLIPLTQRAATRLGASQFS